jgi:hypothetical protein
VSRGAFLIVASVIFGLLPACEEPPAKAPERREQTTVPANSISDARMRGEEDPKDRQDREVASAKDKKDDPTEPYTTRVGAPPAGSPPSKREPKPSSGGGGGNGAVSKAECDRVMDRYLELEIANNPQLKGVPPEVIEQAKQMAREKQGESPCTATRTQYTCGMAASSTAAWQRCMK